MRRKSEAHEKADQAAKLAAADDPEGDVSTPPEEGSEPGADNPTDDPEGDVDEAPEPPEPKTKPEDDAHRQAPIFAPHRKRPGVLRSPLPGTPEPNRPSFAWVRNAAGEIVPNLLPGEEITDEGEVNGIRYVRTSRTRFIYLCTAKQYEAAIDNLEPRETFRTCFPHAFE